MISVKWITLASEMKYLLNLVVSRRWRCPRPDEEDVGEYSSFSGKGELLKGWQHCAANPETEEEKRERLEWPTRLPRARIPLGAIRTQIMKTPAQA